jgi:predicted acylesterase/phospholipase RssA
MIKAHRRVYKGLYMADTDFKDTPTVERARQVLAGTALPDDEALALVKALRAELAFGLARQIAARYRAQAADEETKFQLLGVEVTSTYKDLELPLNKALEAAWRTLKDAGYDPDNLRRDTLEYRRRATEVLGLAGAIYKRWWEYDGQTEHLERSLYYYRCAYGNDVATDDGYQAINAAFVLDLLAGVEVERALNAKATAEGATVQKRRREADDLRGCILNALGGAQSANNWWRMATVAEALFGLRRYAEAAQALKEGLAQCTVPDWEREATLRQLAALARVQSIADGNGEVSDQSPAWKALVDGFGSEQTAGVRSAFAGKIGLALSGGGFRASLYHLGVLARLAELDLLRHVEVLSCVSGGSIIGAHLYLELRHLLQTKPDSEITREDYITIVQRIERVFLAGIQTNIRTRLLADFGSAWRNTWSATYSQTERLGELFEEVLYSQVPDRPGESERDPRWLHCLYVEPAPNPADAGVSSARMPRPFNPRLENWKRRAKVPILILNATTLNTGHTWQFTASYMGEPPAGLDPTVDANSRLRRVRYQDAPQAYRNMRLGHAVAASAAVPALFDPLVIASLYDYEEPLVVRLSDGGVYDNQGIAGLLEQGCTLLLISDASGQLPLAAMPAGGRLPVAKLANDILMERVRGVQYRLLEANATARTLRGVVYVHLKQELDAPPISWKGCAVPPELWIEAPGTGTKLTHYGMRRDVQACLAALRTDLDAFHDFEAWALMESGYRTISYQLREHARRLSAVLAGEHAPVAWRFHVVKPFVTSVDRPADQYDALCGLLSVGKDQVFKRLSLQPSLRWQLAGVIGVLALALLGIFLWFHNVALPWLGALTVAVGLLLATVFASRWLGRTDRRAKTLLQRLGAAAGLGIAAGLYLCRWFRWNETYLGFGKLDPDSPDNATFLTRISGRQPK